MASSSVAGCAVGVDLGGTKVCAGVVTRKGKLLAEPAQVPTEADRPRARVLGNVYAAIEQALQRSGVAKAQVAGIGVGAPGPLRAGAGRLLTPPNLPSLHGCQLAAAVRRRFGRPVFMHNDANVYVLGEACFGAGRDCRIVCGVTLGTGFGAGLVIDREIYDGATGTAMEIWFTPYRDGITEDYVSGRGLEATYARLTGKERSPAQIASLARRGDRRARQAYSEFGGHLGMALVHLVGVVDPEVVVMGGSISSQHRLFMKAVRETLRAGTLPEPRKRVRLVTTQLKGDAALLGAASLVFENRRN